MEENKNGNAQNGSEHIIKEAIRKARFMPILMCALAAAGLVIGYFFWSGRYMWGMLIGAAVGSILGSLVDLVLMRVRIAKSQIREAKEIRDTAEKTKE